jgi:hypothetical protein
VLASAAIDPEAELVDAVAAFTGDPLGYVLFAFPWNEPGALADRKGPDDWQANLLDAVGDGLLTIAEAIQRAVASGHGVGKSALVSWLLLVGDVHPRGHPRRRHRQHREPA